MSENHAKPDPVIELVDVNVCALRQPRQEVLLGVNWSVSAGEFWAVGGLHASGKSDLLALLGGLTSPLSGTCKWFGRELKEGFLDEMVGERQRVGLVFDGGQLLNRMTVRENIALPLLYHRGAEAATRADQLLEWMDLSPLANRLPGNISRGWRQRTGLARALALRPEVLLLDAPLTGIDPAHTSWWLKTVDRLNSGHECMDGRATTIVATCDDLRPWRNRARQFAMLKDRELKLLGGRAELAGQTETLARDLLAGDFGPG